MVLVSYSLNLGCSTMREVPISDVQSSEKVASVVYPSGEVVEFDEQGGIVNSYRGTIDGTTVTGTVVSIALGDVMVVRAKRTDTARTILWTAVGIGVAVGVVVALLSGNNYSFP